MLKTYFLRELTFAVFGLVAGIVVLVLVFAPASLWLLEVGLDARLVAALGGLVFAVVVAGVPTLATPAPVAETLSLWLKVENRRWRGATGWTVPQRSRKAMARWLSKAPDDPRTQWARAWGWIWLGEYDRAAELIGRMPRESEQEAFDQALMWATLRNEKGENDDLAAPRLSWRHIDRTAPRNSARAAIAFEEARRRFEVAGDWRRPLADARQDFVNLRWTATRQGQTVRKVLLLALLCGGAAFVTIELLERGVI